VHDSLREVRTLYGMHKAGKNSTGKGGEADYSHTISFTSKAKREKPTRKCSRRERGVHTTTRGRGVGVIKPTFRIGTWHKWNRNSK